jgi:hypothetical protein
MNKNLPDDVLPEHEELFNRDNTIEDSIYQQEQDARVEEQRVLRERCILNGDNAEKFLASDFGQYLLGQAEYEAGEAMKLLSVVSPEDTKEIRRLQNIIQRYESFHDWIQSAVEQGDAEYAKHLEEQQTGET